MGTRAVGVRQGRPLQSGAVSGGSEAPAGSGRVRSAGENGRSQERAGREGGRRSEPRFTRPASRPHGRGAGRAVGAARAPLGEGRDGGAHARVAGERGETRSTVLEGAEWPSERFLKVRDSVSRTRAPTLCASRSPRSPAASAPTAGGGRDGAGRAGDSGWRRHGNHKPCPPEWGTPPRGGWGPDAGVDGASARSAVPRSAPGVALRAELSSAWLRRSVGARGRARCPARCPRCPSPACARGKSSDPRPVPLPLRKERG